jgi:hypothetical protein
MLESKEKETPKSPKVASDSDWSSVLLSEIDLWMNYCKGLGAFFLSDYVL